MVMDTWFSLGILCSVLVLCQIGPTVALTCQHYDANDCKANKSESACRLVSHICPLEESDQTCFALWQERPEGPVIMQKGCWHRDDKCTNSQCVNSRDDDKFFCCCSGHNCNHKVLLADLKARHEIVITEANASSAPSPRPSTTTAPPREPPRSNVTHVGLEKAVAMSPMNAALVAVIVFICLMLLLVATTIVFRFCRQQMLDGKKTPFDLESALVMAPLMSKEFEHQDGSALLKNLQLLERNATGRYGEVWKGRLGDVIVAVKVTPSVEMASWKNEVHVYHKFLMPNPHANVLRFSFAGHRVAESRMFLVTEYHPLGSLVDLLKGRAITNEEAERIVCSMLAGLSFLHDTDGKPAIAHRDFKSTNVLIKKDMTACIADFGLATAFEADERIGDKHGQVGTRRYMAPELLEGAISLNVVSFLRVDIYACGLVLWEILSRTQLTVDENVGIFRLPLEEELGTAPTNDAIQTAVVHKRLRPSFKSSWRANPRNLSLCLTIEECWDADPEARPSASCLLNRMRLRMSQTTTMVDYGVGFGCEMDPDSAISRLG